MKNITEHTGDVATARRRFDVNSKYLYYLTDTGSEFRYVARYDLATGKTEVVEKAPWDVSLHLLLAERKVSRDGDQRRRTHEDQDLRHSHGKLVALPQLPNADITGVNISPSEKLMAFYLNGDRSPAIFTSTTSLRRKRRS
jgi:hypothetical protein